MKPLAFLFLLLFANPARAQTETEVYLADIEFSETYFTISNLINISNNPGYDNQPSFLPDNSGVLYSGTRNGQTDVVLYTVNTGTKTWLTDSEGSEYSPTVMPGGTHFSTIILKPDGEQLLWKYPLSIGEPEVVVPDEVIGYHSWLDAQTLYAFVLGDVFTFVEFKLGEQSFRKVIATNPGRSIHKVPGKNEVSFVNKNDSTNWLIKSYHPETKKVRTYTSTPPNSEDMFWTNDGNIIMGTSSGIALWTKENGWSAPSPIFEKEGIITRVSLSPDNTKIAIVFSEN